MTAAVAVAGIVLFPVYLFYCIKLGRFAWLAADAAHERYRRRRDESA